MAEAYFTALQLLSELATVRESKFFFCCISTGKQPTSCCFAPWSHTEDALQKSDLAPKRCIKTQSSVQELCLLCGCVLLVNFFFWVPAQKLLILHPCFIFPPLSLHRISSPSWSRFSAPTSWSAPSFYMKCASLFETEMTTHRVFSSQDTMSLSVR